MDLWGHPEHPLTAGKLCTKVDNYLLRSYHAERLQRPLRRVGAKGEGRFEAIGWGEAIAEIAERLGAVIARSGPEAVLPYSYSGTLGFLQGEGMASRLFNRMGASQLARTICASAGSEGLRYTIGRSIGPDPLDLEHAGLVVLWGSNTLTSNMHLWPVITRARKRGAKVVVIDPLRTRTAKAADQWIPIRPGTDAALALALMHVLVVEDRLDHDYIAQATVGFEDLAARVSERWSPARAEEITGVPGETITALARELHERPPAMIRINYGLQRHRGGGMAVRTIACLPALTGDWQRRGGGVLLSNSGSFVLDRRGLERPDLLAGRQPRTFNMNRLGQALSADPQQRHAALLRERPADPEPPLSAAQTPVEALLVYNCNPAATVPDQGAVRRGLAREGLFTVVLEHFATDTVDWADIVLPATTQLEHWDLHKAYGHLYVGLNRPAIAPVGESLANAEIFRRIARALGYDEPCFREDDETILRAFVAAQRDPCMAGISWERLLDAGFCRLALPEPYLPFAAGNFPTPSGRCELRSETMARHGYDPLPDYTPPASAAAPSEQLRCISPPAHSFLNSSFANVEKLARREGAPCLMIHPEDAASRGVVEGRDVLVEGERGSVRLRATLREDLARGTVVAPGVWWAKRSPEGRNINWLAMPDETDMGAGALFYDLAVHVRPAPEPSRAEPSRAEPS
nr:molybdopterin-dependent oxidoreductase [Pseudenhygromyxa sp. WMMC2535]